jgi:hypothetical protein
MQFGKLPVDVASTMDVKEALIAEQRALSKVRPVCMHNAALLAPILGTCSEPYDEARSWRCRRHTHAAVAVADMP